MMSFVFDHCCRAVLQFPIAIWGKGEAKTQIVVSQPQRQRIAKRGEKNK